MSHTFEPDGLDLHPYEPDESTVAIYQRLKALTFGEGVPREEVEKITGRSWALSLSGPCATARRWLLKEGILIGVQGKRRGLERKTAVQAVHRAEWRVMKARNNAKRVVRETSIITKAEYEALTPSQKERLNTSRTIAGVTIQFTSSSAQKRLGAAVTDAGRALKGVEAPTALFEDKT